LALVSSNQTLNRAANVETTAVTSQNLTKVRFILYEQYWIDDDEARTKKIFSCLSDQ